MYTGSKMLKYDAGLWLQIHTCLSLSYEYSMMLCINRCLWRARLSRVLRSAQKQAPKSAQNHLFKIVFVPSPSFLCLTTLQPKTKIDCLPAVFFCVLSFRVIFTQSQSIVWPPSSFSLVFCAESLFPCTFHPPASLSPGGAVSGCPSPSLASSH